MDGMLGLFEMLPPLGGEKSPGVACVVGFLFGGIGLAIYLRSFADFIIPVAAVLLLALFTSAEEIGWLGGAVFSGAYGYMRVLHSNKKLGERAPAS